jgi:hypothetical protein
MTPIQLSAQFAAYLWFVNQPENVGKSNDDAHRFARLNWEQFLANANEGLGRLLMTLSEPRAEADLPRVRSRRAAEAATSAA